MANKNLVTKRGIYLYINGDEIKNDIQSVESEMRKLQNAQKKMTVGSEEYIRTGNKIKSLKSIVSEHNAQWKDVGNNIDKASKKVSLFSKMSGAFNNYIGILTAFVASLTGVSLALNTLKKSRDEFEQKGANLQALTGLSKEDTTWFMTLAKNLSTSVTDSGVRIRKSAVDIVEAFMLVGSARPELLGNKDALADVTKEILILSEAADDMTLKDVVDSTTLIMNQFGAKAEDTNRVINILAAGSQAGSASVNSVAKSLKSSGVAAASANLSMEETVGLIETLAEKGIKDEVAGTGLKTFLLKLQQGADEFNPKVVGMQTALHNLKAEQMEATQMTKMFGLEAYTVAEALISGADRVNYFTTAVTGTNIATQQAVTNTATNAAVLKQAVNKLKLEAMDMVDKLGPVFTISTNAARYLIKMVPPLIAFFKEYGIILVQVGVAVSTYYVTSKALYQWNQRHIVLNRILASSLLDINVRYNAMNALHRLLIFNLKGAKESLLSVFSALKINPWGIFVAGIVAVGTALYSYYKRSKEVVDQTKVLIDINKKANDSIIDEKAQLTLLLSTAKNEKISKEDRYKAIKKLNEISPEYLGNLTLENINTNEAQHSVDRYTDSLLKNAKAKVIQDKLSELYKEQLVFETQLYNLKKRAEDLKGNKLDFSDNELRYANLEVSMQTTDLIKKKDVIDKQISDLVEMFNEGEPVKAEISVELRLENMQSLLYDLDNKRDKLLKQIQDKQKGLPFEFTDAVDQTNLQVLNKQIEDTIDGIERLGRAKGEFVKEKPLLLGDTNLTDKEKKKALDDDLKKVQEIYLQKQTQIKQNYLNQKLTEKEYQYEIFIQEVSFLRAKEAVYKKHGESVAEVQDQIYDKILSKASDKKKDKTEEYNFREPWKNKKKIFDDEEPENNPNWGKLASGTEIQIAANELLYQKGLISHLTYTRTKAELDEKYRQEKEVKDKAASEKEVQAKEMILGAVASLANSALSLMQTGQNKEEKLIEKKYASRLKYAEGDTEETAAIEEEKEAELLEIRKKYADKSFGMQVLCITAETAVAAMRAYSAALELGFPGIPLAPIMAGVAIAAGAVQIANANAQREQAANMWDGGFVGNGNKYEPKKLIQTHGGEWVAQKETVSQLQPLFNVLDEAQRSGRVSELTGNDMARAIGGQPMYQGGFTNVSAKDTDNDPVNYPDTLRIIGENTRTMAKLNARLNRPINATVSVSGKDGIREKLDEYDQLIENVSR